MDSIKGIKCKFRKNGISKDAAIITDIAAALEVFRDVFSITTAQCSSFGKLASRQPPASKSAELTLLKEIEVDEYFS